MALKTKGDLHRERRSNQKEKETTLKLLPPTFELKEGMTVIRVEVVLPEELCIMPDIICPDGMKAKLDGEKLVIVGTFIPTCEVDELVEFTSMTVSAADLFVDAMITEHVIKNIRLDFANRIKNINLDLARVVSMHKNKENGQ